MAPGDHEMRRHAPDRLVLPDSQRDHPIAGSGRALAVVLCNL
jgi:hypothetical protein